MSEVSTTVFALINWRVDQSRCISGLSGYWI